jgi:hypothetical protein
VSLLIFLLFGFVCQVSIKSTFAMEEPNSISETPKRAAAKEAGFEVGDIILAINDLPIRGVEGFVDLVGSLKPNQRLSILALDHRTGNVGTVLVAIGLEHHFQKAHESFLQNDRKEAASEIRKSLAFLKQEADQADEKAKETLKASAQELEKLADEVEKGTVTTVKKLEEAFAHANRALSGHP